MCRNKFRFTFLTLALAAPLALIFSGTALAQPAMSGGKHDFTDAGTYTGAASICEACHSPHSSNFEADAPLWDHDTTTNATFTVYSSGSLNAAPADPAGSDILCLSCHDGSINWNAYGGVAGTATVAAALQVGVLGDLSQDHPVSFAYTPALATADGGLTTPGADSVGTDALPLYAVSPSTVKEVMRCATCHDPHIGTIVTPTQKELKLLRSTDATALCINCHTK